MTTQEQLEARLTVLTKAATIFASTRKSADLLQSIVVQVAEGLHCACALSLIEGAQFVTPYIHTTDPELAAQMRAHLVTTPRPIEAHPGMRFITAERASFFVETLEATNVVEGATDEVRRFAEASRTKSVIVVPLVVDDRVIGALGLSRHGAEALVFDRHDVALAESLATQAAAALGSVRLVEEREAMAARLQALAAASREFAEATGDYDRLLGVVAKRLSEMLGDLCVIRATSEDGTRLEAGAVHHPDAHVVEWARTLSLTHVQAVGDGLLGGVAASGKPVLLRDLSSSYPLTAAPEYRELLEHLRLTSILAVPMVCRERIIGVAALLRSDANRPYTDSDMDLVRAVADHAALSVANARSYAAEQRARAAALRANEALRQSEIANRMLFDASPIALVVHDVSTLQVLAANDAALRLYGYSREELTTMSVSVLVDDDEAAVKARVLTLGDAQISGVTQHKRKNGSIVVVEYVTRPVWFNGRYARIFVVTDVTERQEAERTRALLSAVVESSNDAIVSLRLDGTITSWNGAAERLFGYTAQEAIGQPSALIVPPEENERERALFEALEAGRQMDPYEAARHRKDGTSVIVSISFAPVRDASGAVVGASKTVRDLTAQHRAEHALHAVEEQLRQSQKMEAIGRLAGGIAHDFNNMLSVILGCSDLVLEDLPEDDATRSNVSEIREAAARAADLTRQLLMFSRQQVVAPKLLDLNSVLVGMEKILTRTLGEDIDLVFVSGRRLGRVFVDPSNIEQVIMNLVVNSRDAMPTGGKITVETSDVDLDETYARDHVDTQPGPYVMLAVTDSGTGMDAATRERIFDPFFTTKEVGKGTGLGLATVFGIVHQAGGNVFVYSELGKGTTVKLYFPRAPAEEDEPSERTTESMKPVLETGAETILLVEDQEQVRAVAHAILRRAGYRVIAATSEADALAIAERPGDPISLLLTDVVMPKMSGNELATRVKAIRPAIKVLFMSGFTDDSIVRHGVLESGLAFLQKPFTPESLTRRVREVLDG